MQKLYKTKLELNFMNHEGLFLFQKMPPGTICVFEEGSLRVAFGALKGWTTGRVLSNDPFIYEELSALEALAAAGN